MAAIQGLYQQNQSLQTENVTLQSQLAELETRLEALEAGDEPQSGLPWALVLFLAFLAGCLVGTAFTWLRRIGKIR